MFWFLIGFIIIILGGFIIISLLQIVFMIIGWIIQAIFSLFEQRLEVFETSIRSRLKKQYVSLTI